jgi:hypothetical protein
LRWRRRWVAAVLLMWRRVDVFLLMWRRVETLLLIFLLETLLLIFLLETLLLMWLSEAVEWRRLRWWRRCCQLLSFLLLHLKRFINYKLRSY